MTDPLIVYCADIGSVASGRFGWCRSPEAVDSHATDMTALATSVAADLETGRAVALGFECPLFVPIASVPAELTRARDGEGNRPWSAGPGSGALATGLVQVIWILQRIRQSSAATVPIYLHWPSFRAKGSGLFLWEAFVSGAAKRDSHVADARVAVEAFRAAAEQESVTSCIIACAETYSLIGAALLRSGWSSDIQLLSQPCTVIRADIGAL